MEIGCGGFPAQSTWRATTALGIKGKDRQAGNRDCRQHLRSHTAGYGEEEQGNDLAHHC